MADRQDVGTLYKKEIMLPAAIGDWTAYKAPREAFKRSKPSLYSPRRIARNYLEDTLKSHTFFAQGFTKYLKDALKASTDIFSVTIEQLSYLDFLKRVTGGIIYSKLTVKNAGEVMLLIDYQLANVIINFSLGFQTLDAKPKEFTELEESIIQSIFDNVLDKYAKCWNNIFEKPVFDIISYPNAQRETYINLNETITVVTTQISIANSVPMLLTFVYPNATLKNLTALQIKKEEKAPLNFASLSEAAMNAIEVPIIAVLGATYVYSQELTTIEKDDVVVLDQKLNEPIELALGLFSQLKAQPGINNGHIGVRILAGGTKKVKSALIIRPETAPLQSNANEAPVMEPAAIEPAAIEPSGDISHTENIAAQEDQTIARQEEDFELPLEEEEKEEYNSEELFEEDNNTQP